MEVRKTNETPPRVSVIDLIGAVTKNNNPRDDWKKLRKSHPEVVANSYNFQNDWKFTGQGQSRSPVINARGAILIINLNRHGTRRLRSVLLFRIYIKSCKFT